MYSKIALKWYAILFPGIKTYIENDIFVYLPSFSLFLRVKNIKYTHFCNVCNFDHVCLFANCEHNIDDMDQKSRGFENWIIYLPKSDFVFEKVQ